MRRNSGTRGIQNAAELEVRVDKQGIRNDSAQALTLNKVQLFSTARRIIAPTGAGGGRTRSSANRGAKIGVMMGKHPDTIYRYWLNMLAPVGA